jgi:hypothetical protein
VPITLHDNVPSRWSPAVRQVLRRAVTLAGDRPVDITSIIGALDTDVRPSATGRLPLTLSAYGVLRAANHLRIRSDRATIQLVDLVAALADASFTHPDPRLAAHRLVLSERLVFLNGGSTAAGAGLVTIADLFGQTPSSLVSR